MYYRSSGEVRGALCDRRRDRASSARSLTGGTSEERSGFIWADGVGGAGFGPRDGAYYTVTGIKTTGRDSIFHEMRDIFIKNRTEFF